MNHEFKPGEPCSHPCEGCGRIAGRVVENDLRIDHDAEMDRYYIPVHPRWEIQTKGRGSSFRIAKRDASGDRWLVADKYLHAALEEMARDINAAMLNAAPVIEKEPIAWMNTNSAVNSKLKQKQAATTQPCSHVSNEDQLAKPFRVYKPTKPHGKLDVENYGLPWIYDQDPSSGYSASMLVVPYAQQQLTQERDEALLIHQTGTGTESAVAALQEQVQQQDELLRKQQDDALVLVQQNQQQAEALRVCKRALDGTFSISQYDHIARQEALAAIDALEQKPTFNASPSNPPAGYVALTIAEPPKKYGSYMGTGEELSPLVEPTPDALTAYGELVRETCATCAVETLEWQTGGFAAEAIRAMPLPPPPEQEHHCGQDAKGGSK